MHHIFDLHLPNKQARRFYMTRTRPGSIIRECFSSSGYPFIGPFNHVVQSVEPYQATTTQGYKIRSWIVVKE
jgi:hypothetical protein